MLQEVQTCAGNGLRLQALGLLGPPAARLGVPDDAVDDQVGDMDAGRTQLPRHGLSQAAQDEFGRAEGGEVRPGLYRGGGTHKQNVAAPRLQHRRQHPLGAAHGAETE